jgi:hypothetical protein
MFLFDFYTFQRLDTVQPLYDLPSGSGLGATLRSAEMPACNKGHAFDKNKTYGILLVLTPLFRPLRRTPRFLCITPYSWILEPRGTPTWLFTTHSPRNVVFDGRN